MKKIIIMAIIAFVLIVAVDLIFQTEGALHTVIHTVIISAVITVSDLVSKAH